jgi:allantoicase
MDSLSVVWTDDGHGPPRVNAPPLCELALFDEAGAGWYDGWDCDGDCELPLEETVVVLGVLAERTVEAVGCLA